MIDNKFLQQIGLSEDQITILTDALNKESRYRQILLQENVSLGFIEPIIGRRSSKRSISVTKLFFGRRSKLSGRT